MTKQLITIAIDGPVAAGKSTVARALAHRLGISYFNTGGMYRLLAYVAIEEQVDFTDVVTLTKLIDKNKEALKNIFIDSHQRHDYLYNPTVAYGASCVGLIGSVRVKLVKLQQLVLRNCSAVVEGRDVAKRVMPKATLKVYLTATARERMKRRMEQYKSYKISLSPKQIKDEITMRDMQDSTRRIDPLHRLDSLYCIDTTNLAIPQILDRIMQLLK